MITSPGHLPQGRGPCTLSLPEIHHRHGRYRLLHGLLRAGGGARRLQGGTTTLITLAQFTMLVGIAIEIPFAIGEAILGVEAYAIR